MLVTGGLEYCLPKQNLHTSTRSHHGETGAYWLTKVAASPLASLGEREQRAVAKVHKTGDPKRSIGAPLLEAPDSCVALSHHRAFENLGSAGEPGGHENHGDRQLPSRDGHISISGI